MIGAFKNEILAVCIVIFMAFSPAVKAQSDSLWHKSAFHFFDTGVALLKSPTAWNADDWVILGASAAFTTASVYFFDKPVQQFFSTYQNTFLEKSLTPFEYADFYIPLAIIAGFSTSGVITKNNYTIETAFMIAESCFYNALLTKTVKIVTGRYRPSHWEGPDPLTWDIRTNGRSFFSGHTSMAFGVASVIAYRYRHKNWVPWVSYGLASAVGLQRVYYNKHWLSDVVAGAVSATAVGLFIAKNDHNNSLHIYPIVSPQTTGLSMIINIP